MKVKICGITNLPDALQAVEAGADLLGFNFYPGSPRYVQPENCAAIVKLMRQEGMHAVTVGVFVNAGTDEIRAQLDRCGLDLAQLHGDETPETLSALGERAFKALRPADAGTLEGAVAAFPRRTAPPAFLVDAYRPGQYGGTGETADWDLARSLARRFPLLLAGGLTPENVAPAVAQVRPWGVDVASGVEASPGRKDPRRVADFVGAAREQVPPASVRIEKAEVCDAAEILALQKLAYRSEAEINGDYTIPPLTQTLPEMEAEFERKLVLKALAGGRIVGSVRACLENGTCAIGRLIVHPDWQNQGIGRLLMGAVEAHFAGAGRYELFTSQRSGRNIHLYQKLGYRLFRQEEFNDRVTLVYLEKRPQV